MASTSPALDLRWSAGVDVPAFSELLHAALDDFSPLAIQGLPAVAPSAEEGWRVFFRNRAARDRAAASLATAFPAELVEIRPEDVEDEDWARRSQADLHAIRVDRVIVAPPWDLPQAPADDAIVIVIDPSTGFGTGHHQTTRLCLGLLQAIAPLGERAIDVGTGSGVLAIAAARLGAARVIALDEDPDALANAQTNVGLNGVQTAVSLARGDLKAFQSAPAAVVTANLTGAVLQRHADTLTSLVVSGGALIVSGFAVQEARGVTAAFRGAVERETSEGDWAAALLRF